MQLFIVHFSYNLKYAVYVLCAIVLYTVHCPLYITVQCITVCYIIKPIKCYTILHFGCTFYDYFSHIIFLTFDYNTEIDDCSCKDDILFQRRDSLIGATITNYFLASDRIPHNLSDFLRIHRRLFSWNVTLSETSTCRNILNIVELECNNYFQLPLKWDKSGVTIFCRATLFGSGLDCPC